MMIDAHRATDANLQVARDAADSVTLVKFHYITGMTHELRAPLYGILVHSQILLTIKGYADVSDRIVPGAISTLLIRHSTADIAYQSGAASV